METIEENIVYIAKKGDLSPRQVDALRNGIRGDIVINDRETFIVEHEVSQNSKGFLDTDWIK